MSTPLPAVERAREFLSRRSGRVFSPDAAREAAESLLAFFRLLAEWDRKRRGAGAEFETGKVRGVEVVPETTYPPAASEPGRAAS